MQKNYTYTDRQIIEYLNGLGWTTIDSQCERQVIKDMMEAFPDIDELQLNSVLNTMMGN